MAQIDKISNTNFERFVALWSHRIRKYTHIFKANFHFLKVFLTLNFLKIQYFGKKKIIGIILTQQFGDIVAGEPISRQIREKYPNDLIFWIVKPIFKELVENNPNLNGIIEEFCVRQRKLLLNFNVFDEVFNLQFRNNSHCEICNIWVENPDADAREVTIYNYYFHGNLLTVQQKMAGLEVLDFQPKLYFSGNEKGKIDSLNLPKKYIIIHAQSAQNSRNWDEKKWSELVNWILQNTDYQVVEIGLTSNISIKNSNFINLCGKLSILETAEVIGRAKYFIGIDSGPAHLANAVETKGLVMLGKLENFTNHIPYSGKYKSGENLTIVRNFEGTSAEILVEEVIEELKKKL